jgi:tetratricopeptide (TPR) repeat protein
MSRSEGTTGQDFFVSYTHADRAWAEWIGWQLETAGYTTVLQAWDFAAGSDWAHEMQRATSSARRTIAVLSSAYLRSAYGEAEWRVAFARDPTGTEGRLLPVRVEEVEPPGVLRTRVYIDLVGTNQQTARSRLLGGIGRGRVKPAQEPPFPSSPGQPAREAPHFPGHGPEITNLPARNPTFTGREKVLEALHAQLRAVPNAAEPRAAAIYGLGGVGKTELALEYAYRHAADYDVAWWVPGDRTTSTVAALAELARHLGVEVMADQGDMVVGLFRELRGRDRWLLVYDNAGQAEDLAPLLPPGGSGHLLITSRNLAWTRVRVPLALRVLERVESVAFLRRRTHTDEANADALSELLGDLPLALEEAAAYVEETQVGLGAYLRLARERMSELFGLEQPTRDEQRVATTWSVALDRVQVEAPAAEALLDLCAFFARDDIPRELPGRFPERLPHPLAQAAGDPLAYNDAIRALGRYSLATVTPTALAVHRLVQAVVRARLDHTSQRRWAGVAVGLLYESFPDRSWEAPTWPTCQRLLPHVLAATEHAEHLGVAGEEAGALLDRVSDYLRGRGQPRQARPIAEGALVVTMAALGPDDPATGDRHDTLGRILRDLGDLQGARAELERALAIYEAALGSDYPDVAILRSTLGQVLRGLGDLVGAREQFEQALSLFEAALGPDHPEVGGIRNEIAHVLWARWDLQGARVQLERALVIEEATYGPGHPRVATVRSNLGSVLQDLGDLVGARAELQRAVAILEATLDLDHPEVATARTKLGVVLRDLGDLRGARAELERALAIVEAISAPGYPNIAIISGYLGGVLRDLGDLVEARAQLEQSLALHEMVLEPDHPDVAILRSNLGEVLRELGA